MRSKFWNMFLMGLLISVLLAACQSTAPVPQNSEARVFIPQMQGRALEELVRYKMLSYGWIIVERKPGLLVFDRPIEYRRSLTSFDPGPSYQSLRTHIVFEPTPEGTLLQAQTHRQPAAIQEHILVPVPTTPHLVESVLLEVRRVALWTAGQTG